MAELKTRVEELRVENDYQLRLKDMTYNEKIKELTEKFIQEMESLKTKNTVGLCVFLGCIESVRCYSYRCSQCLSVMWLKLAVYAVHHVCGVIQCSLRQMPLASCCYSLTMLGMMQLKF